MPSAPSFIYRRNKKPRAFAQNFSELACDVIAGVSAWVLLVAVSAAIGDGDPDPHLGYVGRDAVATSPIRYCQLNGKRAFQGSN
jgi:hypothetical protein